MTSPTRNRARRAGLGLAVYVVLCLVCLIWPVFPAAAEVFPARAWGIPFALVWNVAWILITLVVLATYHVASGGERDA